MAETILQTHTAQNQAFCLDELCANVGRYAMALHLLQGIQPDPRIDIMWYSLAKERVPQFIAQMYHVESYFPPRISFMDGLANDGQQMELLSDLEGEKSIATVAVASFEPTEQARDICRRITDRDIDDPCFVVGYALAYLESDEDLSGQGINSYMSSVISLPDFRHIHKLGSRMVQPLLPFLDDRGMSYLTTWVDNGKDGINLCHHPGVGFWYRHHFDPAPTRLAERIARIIREKHEEHGIRGRHYDIKEVDAEEISQKLYRDAFVRNVSNNCRPRYQRFTGKCAIMPEHYENGWSGIIMVRDPKAVAACNKTAEEG